MSISRCGTAPVSFLPQISGLPADFWAGRTVPPDHDHAAATRLPQTWSAADAPVMKRLPESS